MPALSFSIADEVPILDFYPDINWDPYPEGLGEVVERASEYGLPMYITENGSPYVADMGRSLLDGHLASLHAVIEDGADVRGYFYWSWVDNYEWNHGMDLHFGLYGFDAETKKRVERPIVSRYREIASQNALDPS